MTKIKNIFLIILFLLFLTGCRKDNQVDPVLNKNIVRLFEMYKEGINKSDKITLDYIIADELNYYGGSKKKYIEQLINWKVLIEDIKWQVFAIEDYKVLVETKITGMLVYKPIVSPDLFKEQVPLLQGSFQKQALFTLAYNQDGLRILNETEGSTGKIFQWGDFLPDIKTFSLDKYTVSPGDTIKVNISIDKGMNDVIFVFINDRLLSGFSDAGEVPYNEDAFNVRIPGDYPAGKPYNITAMAFAGKIDLTNPQQADLRGIVVKTISVPVK